MILRLFTNCQGQGLEYFLRRALPSWDIKCFPHLATFYGEFSDALLAEEHWNADIVFYHHKHDGELDYPTKQPKIPLSVWYQSAPFMAQIPEDLWIEFRNTGGNSEDAIHHDFNYQARWDLCVERMKQKEEDEGVPQFLRMSHMMASGRNHQLQLTCNHPSSLVFQTWSLRICHFLGAVPCDSRVKLSEAFANPNLAGLPCEESATSGARKHLGLKWGGRPEDDESGRQIARERLAKLL